MPFEILLLKPPDEGVFQYSLLSRALMGKCDKWKGLFDFKLRYCTFLVYSWLVSVITSPGGDMCGYNFIAMVV